MSDRTLRDFSDLEAKGVLIDPKHFRDRETSPCFPNTLKASECAIPDPCPETEANRYLLRPPLWLPNALVLA